MKRLRYMMAWILVRPYRWFFWKCIARGSFYRSCGIQWLPKRREEWDNYHPGKDRKRTEWEMIEAPDFHWVFLYVTVFAFFKWLYYEAWRPLCRWEARGRDPNFKTRASFPWYARLIQRIGETTAGGAISCYECWHCASKAGSQNDLAEDETGKTFILEETWSCSTPDGTDHRVRGTTICPECGYRAAYEEGSL